MSAGFLGGIPSQNALDVFVPTHISKWNFLDGCTGV